MGTNLGVKALVEFEAQGQQEVLASVGRMNSGFSVLGQALRGAGLAVGLQQIAAAAQRAGDEIDQWASRFDAARLSSDNALESIRARMKELNGEGERTKIGAQITNDIRSLKRELADLEFEEMNDAWTGQAWDGLKNWISGVDMDATDIERLQNEIKQRERMQESLKSQPLAEPDDSGKKAEEEGKKREQAEAQLRKSLAAIAGARDELAFDSKLDQAGDNPLAQMAVLQERLIAQKEKLNALEVQGFNAMTMSAEEISQREADMRGLMNETQRLQEQINTAEGQAWETPEEEKAAKAGKQARLGIDFGHLTRIGATLGDPALKGPGNLGRGKDPTFYMEKANQVAEKMLAIMEENRRRNYSQEAAYAD